MLKLLSFRRVAAALGEMAPASVSHDETTGTDCPAADAEIATRVGWAVQQAARHVPFRAVCLPQAVAGFMMLKRRGIRGILHLGIFLPNGDNPRLQAHAWLEAVGREITGYPVAAEFSAVASFIGPVTPRSART